MIDTRLTTPVVDPVQECENSTIPAGAEAKRAARLLSDAEWTEVAPPFCYIKVNYKEWSTLEFEIALKYILRNGTGWVYYRDKKFIFEKQDDYVLFRMWASEKPMVDNETLEVQ